jgi:hypothetical protein
MQRPMRSVLSLHLKKQCTVMISSKSTICHSCSITRFITDKSVHAPHAYSIEALTGEFSCHACSSYQVSASVSNTCPHEANGATGIQTGRLVRAPNGMATRAQSIWREGDMAFDKTVIGTRILGTIHRAVTVSPVVKTTQLITEPRLLVACSLLIGVTLMAGCQELERRVQLLQKQQDTANAKRTAVLSHAK